MERIELTDADIERIDALGSKYDACTPLGVDWAGHVEVRDSYDWDPASLVAGVGEEAILGVEAPLWTETVTTLRDVETVLLPRCARRRVVAGRRARLGGLPREAGGGGPAVGRRRRRLPPLTAGGLALGPAARVSRRA
jgi:hypothetical protein